MLNLYRTLIQILIENNLPRRMSKFICLSHPIGFIRITQSFVLIGMGRRVTVDNNYNVLFSLSYSDWSASQSLTIAYFLQPISSSSGCKGRHTLGDMLQWQLFQFLLKSSVANFIRSTCGMKFDRVVWTRGDLDFQCRIVCSAAPWNKFLW